ncbi:MAG: 6-phospho-3-hexuloisomerase [Halobacteriota archaeon]
MSQSRNMQNPVAQQPEDYVKSAMKVIAANVQAIADEIDYSEVKTLVTDILAAQQNQKRLFVMGAGRSGLVVKGFAMRLMHLGFNVYVVGETVTPAVETGDLLIVISGSGETKSIIDMSALAKAKGTRLAAVTSNRDSTLGTISDAIVVVKGRTKASGMDFMERQVVGSHISFAPLGTMFEISTMVFLDGIIAALMEITKKSEEDLKKKHATLE